jgi:enoyl-CoA hydratase/carnithine racemase
MTDIVSCDVEEGVAFVRMNREEKHNAFHRELSLALSDTIEHLAEDDAIRCLVLTGVGKAFSAGADMTEALASAETGGRGDGMAQAVIKVATLAKPIIVGAPKAKELILTARVVEAQEAERIGLVNQVVRHEQLDAVAREMAREIANQSPEAVRWSKAVIDAASTVEKGGDLEVEANRSLRGSPDHISRFRAATHRVVPKDKQ